MADVVAVVLSTAALVVAVETRLSVARGRRKAAAARRLAAQRPVQSPRSARPPAAVRGGDLHSHIKLLPKPPEAG